MAHWLRCVVHTIAWWNAAFLICQSTKHELYIDLLGDLSQTELISIKHAVNKTTQNSSHNIYLRRIPSWTGPSEIYQYATSLRSKPSAVLLYSGSTPHTACMISHFTRIPLISLQSISRDLWSRDSCKYVLSVSRSDADVAMATRALIKKNPSWTKVFVLHEMIYSAHLAQTQHILADFSGSLVFVLMERRQNESEAQFLRRKWLDVVDARARVVIPFLRSSYIQTLTSEDSCHLGYPLVWILQEHVPLMWNVHGGNLVLSFRNSLQTNTATHSLLQALRAHTGNPALQANDVSDTAYSAYDAVQFVVKAFDDVILDNRWNSTKSSSIPSRGELLREYMFKTPFQGLTGSINISNHGDRAVTSLELQKLHDGRLVSIGSWSSLTDHLDLSSQYALDSATSSACLLPILKGQTLRIVSIQEEPFVFRHTTPDGKVKYIGFCMDILDQLAENLGFNYTMYLSPDLKYGARINGQWDGMVKELVEKKADMSVASFTVTSLREQFVDYTVAYLHYTYDMLLALEDLNAEGYFLFMKPLSNEVWGSLAGCIVFIGLLTFVFNYYCPYGWNECEGKGTSEEFTLFNSLWFSVASFLQQGTDNRPKSVSGRILAGIFWFCILVWVSTYTANLAAYFTAKRATTTIKNIEDVVKTDRRVGVTSSSALYTFFMNTKYEPYENLWHRMREQNSFPPTTTTGIKWASNGSYVHIGDAPTLQYAANKQCNLTVVPGVVTPMALAFALQQHSPFTKNISISMLKLLENGFIEERIRYWWRNNGNCNSKNTANPLDSKRIDFNSMVGLYIMLACGMLFGFIVLLIEILLHRKKPGSLKFPTNLARTIGEWKTTDITKVSPAVGDG